LNVFIQWQGEGETKALDTRTVTGGRRITLWALPSGSPLSENKEALLRKDLAGIFDPCSVRLFARARDPRGEKKRVW
jgi:hypothetical protein